MWPRQSSAEFDTHHGEDNRRAMRRLIADRPTGILAYDPDPIGWVSVGPRPEFGRLNRSRVTKPVDDAPVWSIVCFYVHRDRRGQGVGSALLGAAIAHARAGGAAAIEGYPLDKESPANADAWWGVLPMFARAGFIEIARRSPTRPVMRLAL